MAANNKAGPDGGGLPQAPNEASMSSNGGEYAAAGMSFSAACDSSPKRPSFPELSASTQMILERLRAGSGGGSNTVIAPGYEDVRRSVLENMKTTISLDINPPPRGTGARAARPSTTTKAATPASATSRPRGGGGRRGSKAGTKRKRAKDDEETPESDITSMSGDDSDSDGDDSITQLPTKTKSGRQVTRPTQFNPAVSGTPTRKRGATKRSQEQALCRRCGRGFSPQTNMIVFCDGCNLGWHQMCHDPVIPSDVIREESKEWLCGGCQAKRDKIKARNIENARRASLQSKGIEEKRAYLSSISHQDLVSILIQATILYPDIPLTPKPQHELAKLAASYLPSPASSSLARGEESLKSPLNRRGTVGNASTAPKGTSTPSKLSPRPPTATPQPEQQDADGDFSRESTPASPPYPKPGNGLMARLPPDNQDMEWLVDDNDFAAFSHIVYDKNGNPQSVEEHGIASAQ